MPDDREREDDNAPRYGSSDDEIRAAAREMQERRGMEIEEPEAVTWFARDTGEPLDPRISTTTKQGAEGLADYRHQRDAAALEAQDRELKNELDSVRIGLEVTDPTQAAKYEFRPEITRAVDEFARDMGVDPAATQPPVVDAAPEQQPARESSVPGLDPEVEKALQNPQVREMLEAQIAAYEGAIQEAGNYARASLIETFPELQNLAPQQYEAALQVLNQQDPARVARGLNVINRAVAIGAETARLNQEHQARQQAQRQSGATLRAFAQPVSVCGQFPR
jgi:hypothetical protein